MSFAGRGLRLVESGGSRATDHGGGGAGASGQPGRQRLGQILVGAGRLDPEALSQACALQSRHDARLGEILVARGWVREEDVTRALCAQWQAGEVDPVADPPDARLIDAAGGPADCLARGFLPWRRLAGGTVVVTARPDRFAADCERLPAALAPFLMAIAPERAIEAATLSRRRTVLARRAETRLDAAESCRAGEDGAGSPVVAASLAAAAGFAIAAPALAGQLTVLWAILTLLLSTLLKTAATVASLRGAGRSAAWTGLLRNPARLSDPPARLPTVSVIVPLFREADIAGRLIARLGRIDYPRELLDILLVVEADDRPTREALGRAELPLWMRVAVLPEGRPRTKPRALNFGLDLCRGSIVGVWDAEDAPEPSQLHDVVRHFGRAGPELACVQGVLDFYNHRRNWLSRCFAVEYAAWFRVMLPGLARLGLVVPLGGTTLFFRRTTLVALGGWDAHNVTEDADLGLRLARRGYRTDIIRTVTEEEPNARALPWIRQRSRWLKGYAMTWAVHMRHPARLWRELGTWRFLGVQVLLLGTVSQFVMAPVLWAYWGLALGGVGPMASGGLGWTLAALFLASEVVNIVMGSLGVGRARHLDLLKWVPTLVAYFPLGTCAAAKALYEMAARPFYWDKTAHGVMDQAQGSRQPRPAAPATPLRALPAACGPAALPVAASRPAHSKAVRAGAGLLILTGAVGSGNADRGGTASPRVFPRRPDRQRPAGTPRPPASGALAGE
ncbi:MAG: glycosyltransferase [Paracoccaceae bacterium]